MDPINFEKWIAAQRYAMPRLNSYLAIFLIILCGGCSIQPLPQDVTQLDTYAIVTQVRCEVRVALKDALLASLHDRGDPQELALAEGLLSGAVSWSDVLRNVRDQAYKEKLERYAGASIAYDFSLDMTEDNNLTGGITLTRPIVRGNTAIGFSVSSDHKRQNTRTFTITDTFEGLVNKIKDDYCDKHYNPYPNYNYPITGRTRLQDTLLTFIRLNEIGALGAKAGASGPKTPTLVDDLQFTTSYGSTISPGSMFTPLGQVLALTGSTGKIDNSRMDVHRVTIAMAMPEKGGKSIQKLREESQERVRIALENASANRTQLDIQKISNFNIFSQPTSIFSRIFQ